MTTPYREPLVFPQGPRSKWKTAWVKTLIMVKGTWRKRWVRCAVCRKGVLEYSAVHQGADFWDSLGREWTQTKVLEFSCGHLRADHHRQQKKDGPR